MAIDDLPADSTIWPIVSAIATGALPSAEQMRRLQTWLLEGSYSDVWQLSSTNVEAILTSRIRLLQNFCDRLDRGEITLPVVGSWAEWIELLWILWLPLAQSIDLRQRQANKPLVQGILGSQGTGKTTLTQILQLLLECMGQRAVSLSIDDLYLPYSQRCELSVQDPRLVWRGPPGTHDVALGIDTLSAFRNRDLSGSSDQTIVLPRFDKSLKKGQGDRTQSVSVQQPTVLLFEGWFVGAQPLPDQLLGSDDFPFVAPILTAEDRQFARDCNHRLRAYLPLWNLVDDLVVLQPQDYRFSLQWRQQAEQDMIDTGKDGLSHAEVADFVVYFWKALHPELFVAPLASSTSALSQKTSLVVNIDRDHRIGCLYLP